MGYEVTWLILVQLCELGREFPEKLGVSEMTVEADQIVPVTIDHVQIILLLLNPLIPKFCSFPCLGECITIIAFSRNLQIVLDSSVLHIMSPWAQDSPP